VLATGRIRGKQKSDTKKRGGRSVGLKYRTVVQASRNSMAEAWEKITEDNKMVAQLYMGYYKQKELMIKTVSIISLKCNQNNATFSRSIYFYKLFYVFQAVPQSIIRSTKLYIQRQVL
jgi:hypothetical protein